MQDSAFLGQLVLGYSPMIDRQRTIMATRVTIFPERRDAPPDPSALLQALLVVWPPVASGEVQVPAVQGAPARAAEAGTILTPLSLNIASEAMLDAMLELRPPPHIMLEVPAFMAGDARRVPTLQALADAGSTLLVKGRPVTELPREVLPCFKHSIIDMGEDRRTGASAPPPGVTRTITTVQAGVRSRADVDAAFERGAVAVLGWPTEDEVPQTMTGKSAPPDLQVVMELIKRVDREEPVEKLEAVLTRDPSLAFRLLRYINSAAFGLSVEIGSFRHALMLLGYQKLKRWLALLLTSASKDPSARPVMFAAVRRGVLMEELGRPSGDTEMGSEMFICGVFSLLDRMLQQPFAELFKSVPVPERVRQALVEGTGPFQPYLDLVCALEQSSRSDIHEAADRAFLGLAEVNGALLRALALARELD